MYNKEKIFEIVREASLIIKNADRSKLTLHKKSNFRDFCTVYDEMVQAFLFEKLGALMPEARFIGEEESEKAESLDGYVFIIDPIDGTTNFTCDYHHSCVSVGLALDGEMVLAIVIDPYLGEEFTAEKGNGAYLNGERFYCRERELKQSIFAFGTAPYYFELTDETFDFIRAIFPKVNDIRRIAAAALDICYVACNRNGAFIELILGPWDYAAASLIVKEAGGVVSNLKGEMPSLISRDAFLCGNKKAYEELYEFYKEFKKNRK